MDKSGSHNREPKSSKNVWICESEKVLHHSPFMEMVQRECRSSEDNRPHRFYVMKSRDWCNIIPITEDGKIVLVKQFRAGISDHTLEIPGGVADPEDKDIEAAAIREMTEETGYVPLPGAKCTRLGWTHPNPAIMDNRCHSLVIGPVRKSQEQELDPGEMIEVVEIAIDELPELVLNGELSHALMLNAFFFLLMNSADGRKTLLSDLKSFARA